MLSPEPLANPVTSPEEPEAIQLKFDPVTPEVGTMLVKDAEQICELVTRLVIAGLGFTVTITVEGGPDAQPNAVGTTE